MRKTEDLLKTLTNLAWRGAVASSMECSACSALTDELMMRIRASKDVDEMVLFDPS